MTTLAQNTPRAIELGLRNELPVAAGGKIFEGSAVGTTVGLARPLVSGDPFHGFAETLADNTGGAAGAITVRVLERGKIQIPVASLVIGDVGKKVYATDDNAFTLTASTNTLIGRVHRFVSAGVGVVDFAPTTI